MSWDTSTPADSEAASQGASRIRELKTDLAAALTAEGNFPVSAGSPQFYPKLKKDTTGNRPAASSNYPGRMFFNSTLGTFQRVKDDGSGWEDVYVNPATQALHQAVAQALASVVGVVTLNENGNSFNVSGTEAITAIQGWSAGLVVVKWVSSRTITYNASTLILRDAVSYVAAAGDIMIFEFTGSNAVREIARLTASKMPTKQFLTSGSGATYTTPNNARRLVVKMIGGGGGGGGAAANHAGSDGSDTSFNSITAKGGSAGPGGHQSAISGGAGGVSGSGSADLRLAGGGGGPPPLSADSGGVGGGGVFGGAATAGGSNIDGGAGATNSGAGGGGGATNSSNTGGAGGGAGEYAEFHIDNPAATYTYTVGAGGAGGATGSGNAGGAGGSGLIIVEEYY